MSEHRHPHVHNGAAQRLSLALVVRDCVRHLQRELAARHRDAGAPHLPLESDARHAEHLVAVEADHLRGQL